MEIKKGDPVIVLTGKDRGKTGQVEKVFPRKLKVVVSGINILKKHKKRTSRSMRGGIVEFAAPIDISNVLLLCPHCNKPTRISYFKRQREKGSAYKITKDLKYRICKHCQGNLDKVA